MNELAINKARINKQGLYLNTLERYHSMICGVLSILELEGVIQSGSIFFSNTNISVLPVIDRLFEQNEDFNSWIVHSSPEAAYSDIANCIKNNIPANISFSLKGINVRKKVKE